MSLNTCDTLIRCIGGGAVNIIFLNETPCSLEESANISEELGVFFWR
jgi:hypothetical protein